MDEGVNQQERCLRPRLYKTLGLVPCAGEAWHIVTTQCAMPRHHKAHDRVSWRLKTLWQLDCLFYSLFKLPTKITSMFCITGPLWGESIESVILFTCSVTWRFHGHPKSGTSPVTHGTQSTLNHFPLDKMAAVSQTTFSSAFSWMKSLVLWISLDLFPKGTQLTITQHWFR